MMKHKNIIYFVIRVIIYFVLLLLTAWYKSNDGIKNIFIIFPVYIFLFEVIFLWKLKNMKISKLIILITLVMTTQTSCSQQPRMLGEKPLELENFDFDLNIKTFIPEKYLEGFGSFHIPANGGYVFMKRDTIYWDEPNDRFFAKKISENAKWILYHQSGNSTDNWLSKYGKFPFLHIGFAVSLDYKTMAVRAQTPEFSKTENDEFIELLKSKYGEYEQETGEGNLFSIYEAYTWNLTDRLIIYTAYHKDKNYDMSTVSSSSPISLSDWSDNYIGYFYIYSKEYADKIIKVFSKSF